MAFNKKVSVEIVAEDKASSTLAKVSKNLRTIGGSSSSATNRVSSLGKTITGVTDSVVSFGKSFGLVFTAAAGVAIYAGKSVADASMKMENALMGLTTVARAFGESQEGATQAAIDLAKDGLMTVTEAATGLKNLLASRFNLDESIKLMNAFKDSAAFNRQAALGFGQAISGATEGIKNGNSILVDNAGITKNLSIILEEAGLSAQDLMRATTDASVRQAIFNGILKEASIFQGDAARATETLSGQVSMLGTSWFNVKAEMGKALSPLFITLIEAIKGAVGDLGLWVDNNREKINEWGRQAAEKIQEVIKWLRENKETLVILADGAMALLKVFAYVLTLISNHIQNVQKKLEEMFYIMFRLIEAVKPYWNIFKNTALNAINAVIDGWNKLRDALSKPVKAVVNIVEKIKNAVSGEKAIGGPVVSNQAYLVGERGPEMFVPNQSGTIVPTDKTSGGATFNFNFSGATIADKSQLIAEIKQAINRELELSRYGIG